MSVPLRQLARNQVSQVWIHDTATGDNRLLYETKELLLEAPNWNLDGDALILNGDGHLWRLPVSSPHLELIPLSGLPRMNNDHVLDPDGDHIFVSTYDDWQIYRAPLNGGEAVKISGREGPENLLHFLHGVSPDGRQLAFVGVEAQLIDGRLSFQSAEICTLEADGKGFQQITSGGVPTDGPEYSPNGAWVYFNTEAFSGHAQIARMRPDGTQTERLTEEETVDWFPHLSPDGQKAVYLAYPPDTRGRPADLWVELRLVENDQWSKARTVARLFGGQGTINVNSWSPDCTRFAFVAYPINAS
ncbi:TolB family protein [Agrobacterium tumefaciens]|uniref:TolB family protein n=1 Tax=Agrobacterium tumefaciens TaxID=358 RepID=UPI001572AF3D|nr:biopolymer transporter Tol [Agrobacterium tumefaciens]NTA19039.1 biopolymer transporter Tol [Agrobacterium tumefaciens]WCK74402.1 biopolymer transporter Tol [Agrobacterium tumefaciens]